MKLRRLMSLLMVLSTAGSLTAAEYTAQTIKTSAPKESISEEVAGVLSDQGVKVLNGDKLVCELWLLKEWDVKPGFEPTFQVLYPFKPGQLIGVLNFPKGGTDFRNQEIKPGVYTLRYALQPQDGNHVGTFDTRDFLVLISAKADKKLGSINDEFDLHLKSADAAGSSHPAMMPLVATGEKVEKLPAMLVRDEQQWWSVRTQSKAKAGDKIKDLPIQIIVGGHAVE